VGAITRPDGERDQDVPIQTDEGKTACFESGAAIIATVNLISMQHLQDRVCRHFTVRRLEHKYRAEPVQTACEQAALVM
jgi:hypothetical protein